MAHFKKLVGEQCYLSPIDPDDAPRFAAWVNDPEVAAGVTLARQVLGVERTRDKLARHAGGRRTSPSSRWMATSRSASAGSMTSATSTAPASW